MQSTLQSQRKVLVGTRVSAPWTDKRYYNGIIDSISRNTNGQLVYSVLFDDGYAKEFYQDEIVGLHFRPIDGLSFKSGQKLYAKVKGCVCYGKVVKHEDSENKLVMEVKDSETGRIIEVTRRLKDVWLLDETKSNPISEGLQRTLRSGTKLGRAMPLTRYRRQKQLTAPIVAGDTCSDIEPNPGETLQHENETPEGSPSPLRDTSATPPHSVSSAVVALKPGAHRFPAPSDPRVMERNSTRSPACYSTPSPGSTPGISFLHSFSTDEGIDVDDIMYPMDDVVPLNPPASTAPPSTSHLYKCIWRGCGATKDRCKDIERHIRTSHLGRNSDSDVSDHEEEFYYDEVEQTAMEEITYNMDVLTCASSPVQSTPLNLSLPKPPVSQPVNVPTTTQTPAIQSALGGSIPSTPPVYHIPESPTHVLPLLQKRTTPIVIPGTLKFHVNETGTPPVVFPENSPYSRSSSQPRFSPQSPNAASPKQRARKSRSDIKKCRKVYGMENKELWCTQCRWKKACTRFVGESATAQH